MSQQPIRVAVLGAAGRMGRILSSMFARDARFELVARVDRHRREESMGVCMPSIIEDLNDAPKFDVLVDFSTPEATESALDIVPSPADTRFTTRLPRLPQQGNYSSRFPSCAKKSSLWGRNSPYLSPPIHRWGLRSCNA